MPVAMKLSMIVETTSFTPRVTFSDAGDPGVGAGADHGDEDDEQHVQRRRQGDRGAGGGREQRADAVLPVGADVEQAHLEAERDRQAHHVVRAGAVEDVHDRVGGVDRAGTWPGTPWPGSRRWPAARSTTPPPRRRWRGPGRPARTRACASCRALLFPRAGHVRAELDRGDRGRVERGDDATAQEHEQRVGQPDQLLQVGGDQEDGQPGGASAPQVRPRCRPARRRRCRGWGARR